MNFPFYCSKVITTDQSGFAILEASNFDRNSSIPTTSSRISLICIESKEHLAQIIDNMGEASSIVNFSQNSGLLTKSRLKDYELSSQPTQSLFQAQITRFI